ncbi:HupE/UreJ family protein [Rugamonas sp. CCM 8940]|uniref:HupE/UreJ family protein n=1 Tax=Rugamonas sp. CCM 8940 TaxID=2765359 RepID=UPI0018F4DF73|nr:HupE/UreJ family protein [Rugamonas sp. CCM 8940]MBJ7313889.1 HupE/UreJ family protein [Rugamonas sp. CCM 8940]
MKHRKILLTGALALLCLPALAHSGAAPHGHGFVDGFAHPFSGADHLLAMLAVGIWSVRQPNAQALPPIFLGTMLLGVLSGVAGLAIPGLELGIALTVALLGGLIAVAVRLPAAAGAALVGLFAFLHGNAHGRELPQAAAAMGLLAASALLILAGRALGRVGPARLTKLSGALIAALGLLLVANV